MPLSWNEIKKRAIEFSKSWEEVSEEKAEAQTFWNEFFNVFGISRRRVALFEKSVEKLDEKLGWIDLFWPKILIAEAKSRGRDLIKAREQAIDYLHGIEEKELPKYILTSDFEKMSLLDIETDESWEFNVNKFHENIKLFSFIAGYEKTDFRTEDPVNIKAAEIMGKLHDILRNSGYYGHSLEVFLVRMLFILFADDTGIFERDLFYNFLKNKTREDGTDVGPQLELLFQILNTPEEKRYSNLDEDITKFPYVNGKLFEERIETTFFDSDMRDILIICTEFDWGKISPAVFGSLFQSVMNKEERRNLGAHYTSEENILKVIRPLFLDELWEEFNTSKTNRNKLIEFQSKLSRLKFLDPACGCGNFLVVTYKELRILELEVIKILYKKLKGGFLQTKDLSIVNVDQMTGIEIEEFPARISEVAMWLVDHQMNVRFSEEMGKYYVRLPLMKKANIVNANALITDWNNVVSQNELTYILGNPPFIGSKFMNEEEREEIKKLSNKVKNYGILDYVSGWYFKAAEFIQGTKIKVSFVSTNSISQGEQVSVLWGSLLNDYGIKIHFAHRTFQWNSEARGKATVQVVIIGFANYDIGEKYLFEYENVKSEPDKVKVKNINPYLVDGVDILIFSRQKPISDVPEMSFGNMPLDGGNLILSEDEYKKLIKLYPEIQRYIKELISAKEFLNGGRRYCIWLLDIEPSEIVKHKVLMERINKVRIFRESSKAESTRKFSDEPMLFRDRQNPEKFVVLPRVSSENRKYIPVGFFQNSEIVSDTCLYIPNASLFHFGVLTSEMHMSWMRYVAGRLESRYRYSKNIVYNNFPWPEEVSKRKRDEIIEKSMEILKTRKKYTHSTLANLYNPLTTPSELLRLHREMDRLIDSCYSGKTFRSERERIEFLIGKYKEQENRKERKTI